MKKYNFIFDGSILTNEFTKNDARSGIFFMAKNILFELLKRDDINLFLYSDASKIPLLKEFVKKYGLNTEIINEGDFNYWQKKRANLRDLKSQCDKKKHPLKRTVISLCYSVSSAWCKIYNGFIFHNRETEERLKTMDFYFSPCTKTPDRIKKYKNIISSVYLHDTIPLILPEYKKGIKRGWFRDLFYSLNEKEVYFANSECTKRDFVKYSKNIKEDQITVAYLATANHFVPVKDEERIKQAKIKYHIPADKKYLFSLCTLEPRKNLIRAVKTFINFIEKNKIDDLCFVLGGGHWDKFIDILKKEINQLDKYQDKIIHAGYIDDEDLPLLYSNAHWFVYTSQYEGFGLPALEALSCGCPVIASTASSLPEVVGDSGILIEWDSDEQHIAAYEKYYFNPALREENIKKGLERTKQFSWKKCSEQIYNTLKEKAGNVL